MADDKKKTKIDLKARLGKTQTGMTAVPLPVPGPSGPGSQPAPPPSADGVPAPSVPVPMPSVRPSGGIAPPSGISGMSPGIPLPPFAQPRQSQREPAQKPTAAQQTIKVEIGEEIHAERKKAAQRTALFAVLAAAVGLGAGFFVGGAQEKSARGNLSVKAAGDLEKDVKAANEKIKELGEKLQEGYEKLGKKEFPDLGSTLGGINIPFDSTNLEKPGVGTMGKSLKSLFKYTSAIQELNIDKDQLKNVIGTVQPQIEKAWKEEKEPIVNFSVIFRPEGGKGIVAEFVPNKEPFAFGKDFADTYTVVKAEMQQGQLKPVEKKATRWKKGDLTGNDPVAIPVAPASIAFLSDKSVLQIRLKILEQMELIFGKNKDTPQETAGLLKEGDDLANELHKLSLAK